MHSFRFSAIGALLALGLSILPSHSEAASSTSPAPQALGPTDLQVTKQVLQSPIVERDRAFFVVTVRNNGANDAANVEVVDTSDPGLLFSAAIGSGVITRETSSVTRISIGTLAANTESSITLLFDTNSSGTFQNVVSISSDEIETDPTNNVSTATVEVLPAEADLNVVSFFNTTSEAVGGIVSVGVLFGNLGPLEALGTTVTATFPPGLTVLQVPFASVGTVTATSDQVTLDIGKLAADTTGTLFVEARIDALGPLTAQARIQSATLDPVPDNNESTATILGTPFEADVAVTKSAAPIAQQNIPFTYTIDVFNNGPETAYNVVVTDPLPPGGSLVGSPASDSTTQPSVSGSVVTAPFGDLQVGQTGRLTISYQPTALGTLLNTASATTDTTDPLSANNSASTTVTVQTRVSTFLRNDYTTQGTYLALGFQNTTASTTHNDALGAYVASIGAGTPLYSATGIFTDVAERIPYSAIGTDKVVRAKFFVYRDAQPTTSVPGLRLRVANRFAVNSMLEVFSYTPGDLAIEPFAAELSPSTDPARPSLYRVDIDPVDIPYLLGSSTEGVIRGFEAVKVGTDDIGALYLTESSIGTYTNEALPLSTPASETYVPAVDGPGDLVLNTSILLNSVTFVFDPATGTLVDVDNPANARPQYTEGTFGITLDARDVATTVVGLIAREIDPPNNRTVRVEPNKQYLVRWHLASDQVAQNNAQIRLRTRSVKFAWSQKLELGGGWAIGSTAVSGNAAIAGQSLPGIGTLNPDRRDGETTGGYYNMIVHTPLSADIRAEFADGTDLATRMPNLTAQPGPGDPANSFRDLKFGIDLFDTLSPGPNATLEQGNVTLDEITVRTYDLVPD